MKRHLMAAALAFCALPQIAAATEFTIFVYETPQDFALRSDAGPQGQAYWAEFAAFAEKLHQAGAIRGGAPLQLPAASVRIDVGGVGTGTVASGPLQLGGYFKIEAADMAAARDLAMAAPSARRGGAVEIRETYPAPMMSKN